MSSELHELIERELKAADVRIEAGGGVGGVREGARRETVADRARGSAQRLADWLLLLKNRALASHAGAPQQLDGACKLQARRR